MGKRRLKPRSLSYSLRKHRVVLAVSLGAVAATSVVLLHRPDATHQVSVLRVTEAVNPGDVLSAEMVEESLVDAATVSADALADPQVALDQPIASSLPAGAVVYETQLLGPGLLTGFPPGTVAAAVPVQGSAFSGLLNAGDRVDVMVVENPHQPESSGEELYGTAQEQHGGETFADADGIQRIAAGAPVIWAPEPAADSWGGSSDPLSQEVLIAVDSTIATRIMAAAEYGQLVVTVVSADPEDVFDAEDDFSPEL